MAIIIKRLLNPLLLLLLSISISFYWQGIFAKLGLDIINQTGTIVSYGVGVVIWLSLAWFINRCINVIFWDYFAQNRFSFIVPSLIRDVISVIIYFTAVLGIFGVVFQQSVTGLLAASGAVGIVVGLAIKNVISDVFNGVAINLDRPFQIGEYVYLHDPTLNIGAKVKEITWRTTRFETDNKNILIVPNSKLCMIAITNMSRSDRILSDLAVTLDSSVPIERALILINAAMKSAEGVLRDPAPSVSTSGFADNGVIYRLFYHIDRSAMLPFKVKHNIITNLLKTMQQAGIPFAIPRSTIFHAPLQKRDHTRAPQPDYFIDRISLFNELNEEEKQKLCHLIQEHRLRAGTTVIDIDQAGDTMFIVVEGLLEVLIPLLGSETLIHVAYLSGGDFFGEMSLLTGEPRSAKVVADTDVLLYEIPKTAITDILLARPSLAEHISKTVADRKAKNLATEDSINTSDEQKNETEHLALQILNKMKSFFGF